MAQGLTNLIHKDTGDGTITIIPWAYSSITAGTWAFGISANYPFNGVFYNSTNAINDQINYKVWLSKGYWTFGIKTLMNTSSGVINILLDATIVGMINLVANSVSAYVSPTYTMGEPLYSPTTGLKTLSVKIIGKEAWAVNYTAYLELIILQRAN